MSAADRRRMGLVLSVTIATLAVVVAALPLIQGSMGSAGIDGPAIVPRPLVIGSLLAIPAVIGAIGATHGSRPLFVAAGVLCLLQSFIAFSGVTLGFVLPAILLLALGLRPIAEERPSRNRARLGGALIVGLGIAAWIAPFVLAETVCWIARSGVDGAAIYERIPITDTITLAPGMSAGGCDGGSFTLEGLLVGGMLEIGAVAIAWLTATSSGPAAA